MDTAPILRSKRLFIEDLARRIEAMERSETQINPVAYRLYARRLREATAGYPEALLRAQLGGAHHAVLHVLARRHFDAHGRFPGADGAAAQREADRVLRRAASGVAGGQ